MRRETYELLGKVHDKLEEAKSRMASRSNHGKEFIKREIRKRVR